MNRIKGFLLILFAVVLVQGLQAQKMDVAQKPGITVEDIWLKYKFYPKFPSEFNWMKDDNFYSVLEKNQIIQYSIQDQKPVKTILDLGTLRDPETGDSLGIESYQFSKDESKILLISDSEPIYRRSSLEVCYVYDSGTQKLQKIQQGKKISFAEFSPDGTKLAYMHDNNMWWHRFEDGKSMRFTTDGKTNSILNGGTDWVYEEEFSFTRAFTWSTDSKRIAFYRFDESRVKEFSMDKFGTLYPEPYKFKYPKAGEDNAIVTLNLYDIEKNKTYPIDIGNEKDQYIPRIKWTKSPDQLAVMRMNRLQNKLEFLLVEAKNGASKVIFVEKDEDGFVDEVTDHKWTFLENGKEYLWMSEQDGHNHIYLNKLDGSPGRQITSGNWDVTDIVAVDEKEGAIYFLSTQVSPRERHLFRTDMKGDKPKQLTKEDGMHEITFSSNNSYYMDSWSTISSPPKTSLFSAKGKEILMLEENKKLAENMANANLSSPEFFTFSTENKDQLDGWMIKPTNFNPNQKYPVLMFVYGGPGSQTVKNEFMGFNYFWHQMLAQQGYIIVSVDGRGTGARGEAFKKVTYGQLGKYELEDQIQSAKYLAGLGYVDAGRIGIWGWSFGGYLSSLAITKGADFFKMAIAVAPVTSWRYYDTIYTERYLKTPQLNAAGYDDNSPLQYADKLKGSYLLVHGTADDNVHFQNSLEWVSALVNANKQFETFFYPDKNHGIFGGVTRFHLYTKMTNFIKANL